MLTEYLNNVEKILDNWNKPGNKWKKKSYNWY